MIYFYRHGYAIGNYNVLWSYDTLVVDKLRIDHKTTKFYIYDYPSRTTAKQITQYFERLYPEFADQVKRIRNTLKKGGYRCYTITFEYDYVKKVKTFDQDTPDHF